ncbi:hypothetical protein BVY04_03190 [bacterium M21]|nr:hypothetical protein BVY04_03190 [bacterium M21]
MGSNPDNRPLWAPWRIQYILDDRDNDCGCFICGHAANPDNDIENNVIARGETCFVFLNKYPYNSGHILISPYRHLSDLNDLTNAERLEMITLLAKAENVCKAAMNPEAFNMGCNLGKVAGAAVEDHIHFHFVPRWNGDTNFMPIIGGTDCVPQALTDTAALLRKHWDSSE